ncbi:hypothetical protein PFUGPA_03177 [Plasmodium falciparum Palo Alto/Uganda]|uniref:DUF1279 domain-containing protein n=6 Tax=Plasmodium falciparum TaxID=5833 RepID=C0H5E6_PLAF7|nr:conserved protein, unknown function [Plasmodium falciparum 3D7]ETW41075.1 hypothetical protein PFNF135_04709 [Plasmodium falciparum NF135/5.C10]ETW54569.1 hypothetical protein PFUGPA_03177 [Plasmodium falciparum Palo Alto/Uganda]ETW59699.1 hypothetical protein PFMC_04508 [Plasmodium falciparum CAMP/Malaysia]EWC86828.1 hypothetical protein PFNF54_04381 [Plasmodium falciparum NF54]KAF4327851.1 hypothetical protein CYL21_4052 [Plasmodium falciparum NF54]|eukprot:XP_002809043.1 conserved Plasmodium protein, unknown function [Plasmodium falciparum 3D7]
MSNLIFSSLCWTVKKNNKSLLIKTKFRKDYSKTFLIKNKKGRCVINNQDITNITFHKNNYNNNDSSYHFLKCPYDRNKFQVKKKINGYNPLLNNTLGNLYNEEYKQKWSGSLSYFCSFMKKEYENKRNVTSPTNINIDGHKYVNIDTYTHKYRYMSTFHMKDKDNNKNGKENMDGKKIIQMDEEKNIDNKNIDNNKIDNNNDDNYNVDNYNVDNYNVDNNKYNHNKKHPDVIKNDNIMTYKNFIKLNKNNINVPDNNKKYLKKGQHFLKINYLKNMYFLLLSKRMKECLYNLKCKHSYRRLMKRIKKEKDKINNIFLKYQIKKGNIKSHFNEHTYRKALMNMKKNIFTSLKRNRNKSIMDVYYEEKKKYKLRKQKLLELQTKIRKNSQIAHSSIKRFFKKYGYVGLGTYFFVFLLTFCSSYFFVHFKYISLADLKYVSEKMHLNKYIDDDLHKKIDSLWGELIFAYVASKITEPIRIVITILITPYIARAIKFKKKSRLL